MIAHIRDLAFDYKMVAESFETCVRWSSVLDLCSGVRRRIKSEAKAKGVHR